jgi:hypothetical protein
MIGIAIRDAQELGMHRDNFDSNPIGKSLEEVLENQWLIERRRKVYMVLATWYVPNPYRASKTPTYSPGTSI